jgi:DNA-directed RNA polymerase subunit RPC12/RpoP
MKCLNCSAEMTSMTLEAHLTAPVTIDLCAGCQAFWFDKYEDLQLSAGSVLKLMKLIGENSSPAKTPLAEMLRCHRCASRLLLTHDLQRNTKFSYWRCEEHGRFIGFLDFLREKNFIRTLSPQEIKELREKVQTVNCSNCGAAISLATDSVCTHCGSPISILDMKQPQQMLNDLKKAAEPRPVDPALPLELARVKRETEHLFGPERSDPDWLSDASSSSLVHAGLNALARWLTKSGV